MVYRYIAQCSCSGSPACRQCSRTSRRSIPTTQPSSACAEHARATRLHKASAAAGAQRASVWHMHPCTHEARQCFPRPRPCAPRKLVGGRSAHERGLGGMVMLSSPPASLAPKRVQLPCSSASRDQWPIWTGTRSRASRLCPSHRSSAAAASAAVRRTPDLRHQKLRTP